MEGSAEAQRDVAPKWPVSEKRLANPRNPLEARFERLSIVVLDDLYFFTIAGDDGSPLGIEIDPARKTALRTAHLH